MKEREIPQAVFIGAIVVIVAIVAVIGYNVFAGGRGAGTTEDQKKMMKEHQGYSAQGGPAPASGYGGSYGSPGGSMGGRPGGSMGGGYGGQRR